VTPVRQPQGQPTGGQFAAQSHPEPEMDLETVDTYDQRDRSHHTTLHVEMVDDDGTSVKEVELPTRREVCGRCNGDGHHTNPSIDGNGITSDEWAEWDDDEKDGYLSGRYDVPCEECHGRNVVDVVDYDALTPEYRALWEQQVAYDHEYQREVAAERRMGA